ncbi:alpha-amylase family glycosyl hydrolase [Gaoshiqia sediminis]|uniref:Alpha-amylase family glycosyl hydrolase n=1 Tax=Gaoshiqia sediminis TaxID=2986998 RepID=A0AA41Y968_9BACT|nr:alpha-amylase family glycosyl hydrolase [Gaoshiqia sediminis]MCW0481525.1 alpha-amylase family glycosyl hydrolase [Gaoshiqia sediminis]
MANKFLLFIFFQLLLLLGYGQVTTTPSFAVVDQPVTIAFDATQGTAGLQDYTGDVYAHTGVITDQSTSGDDWKYVLADWEVNVEKAKMTRISANIYQLQISPDIRSFYGLPQGETIKQMAFVFRSADSSKEGKATGGKNIYVTVYQSGLNVTLSSPASASIFQKDETIHVEAMASTVADLSLTLNETELVSANSTELVHDFSLTEAGNYWLKITATADGQTAKDSLYFSVRNETITESRPAGIRDGINYIDDQTVTLSLLAPGKSFAHVIGDFNDWLPNADYQMKQDGDHFWLTVSGLEPQREYVFQYLVDGEIRIGDPYSDKVSDPYDDHYISSTAYPNLISYPAGKTEGRASVLQTAQVPYTWETTNYTLPEIENLHIYELLIRDFTAEKTYKSIRENLDYFERLGVNTLEFMPFSEFEGNSSWGYNPNYYFAPDKAYGTKNDLKELIDSCHRRGFVVIQDIVLNHAYNSSPMVQLYWDAANNRPAANNPWFNVTSPNPVFAWGSDFDHDSPFTQAFVDSVTSYWLTEYKVDGFRFDFTKGFTNTPGDGSAYDAARIAILQRMADHIWSVKPEAIIILEHFADNAEEKILTSYQNGMLVWGNANFNFNEATMGFNESGKSDFSWASWQKRGFTKPGLVAYMESHDEERLMYKNLTYGNVSGSYNIKNLTTALKRNEMATAFFLCLTGPKMIWQFVEFGYDVSIDFNGRVGEKPLKWEYLDDADRMKLFDVYSAMLRLRDQFPVFTSGVETLNLNDELKSIQLAMGDHHITLIGNFGMTVKTIQAPFQHTGTWHEFFTGTSYNATATSMALSLQPGEYRLYSDQPLPAFKDLATEVEEPVLQPSSDMLLYPNPASSRISISCPDRITDLALYSMDGRLVKQLKTSDHEVVLPIDRFQQGLYIIQAKTEKNSYTRKFIKSE